MKKLIPIFFILSFLACNYQQGEVPEAKPTKDGMLIHISHGTDDLHRVMMGLALADKIADENNVMIFFDIKGPEIALKKTPNHEESELGKLKDHILSLLKKGAHIMVCPMCLKKMGKTEGDLVEGIETATKEAFFTFTDGRIVTLDY